MSSELLQLVQAREPAPTSVVIVDFTQVDLTPYARWKRLFDVSVALVLLMPGVLLIGCLILLVRITSAGPAIFRQVRVGRHGKRFVMYKIRTMIDGAEHDTGPKWADAEDPRMTPVGRLIRLAHLDELPQLFNVLKGDMSIVGPRPERPVFVQMLYHEVPGYADRLAVRPGITGLAQVNLPPDTDLESVRRKLVLDLDYIRSANLFLDIRLLTYSCLRLLLVPDTVLALMLGLKRKIQIPNSMYRDNTSPESEEDVFKRAGITPGKPR